MDFKKCFKEPECSKKIFHYAVKAILVLIVALAIFQIGRLAGFRQAMFSGQLGDNYYRAFEGPGRGPLVKMGPRGFWSDDLPNGHGAAGKIIKINLPNIVILGPDNVEKVVKINNETLIRRFREELKPQDLKTGDLIVTIGSADEASTIITKFIRVLPPPPQR